MKPTNFMPFFVISIISIACIGILSLIMQNQTPTVQKDTVQENVLTVIPSDEPILKTLFEETNLDTRKILVGHTWRYVGTDYKVLIIFGLNNIHLKILSPTNPKANLITTGTWEDIGENKVKLQYFDYEVQTIELKIQSKTEFICGIAVYKLYGT